MGKNEVRMTVDGVEFMRYEIPKPVTDYRKLLAFYIDWVVHHEGTSFISLTSRDALVSAGLSGDDADALIAIDVERDVESRKPYGESPLKL